MGQFSKGSKPKWAQKWLHRGCSNYPLYSGAVPRTGPGGDWDEASWRLNRWASEHSKQECVTLFPWLYKGKTGWYVELALLVPGIPFSIFEKKIALNTSLLYG
jgi:hypothetical protein